jgi:hypothetical protein
MITYLIGDATQPQPKQGVNDIRLIFHITNSAAGWGRGFVLSLSRRWKEPEYNYRKWSKETEQNKRLGQVQFVPVQDEHGTLYVANMCAQEGYVTSSNSVPLRYTALTTCLNIAREWVENQRSINNSAYISIHGPRLGSGLAKGNWPKIEEIINVCLNDEYVFIYDLI